MINPGKPQTQGPYTALWELGDIEVTLPDGRRVQTSVTKLQAEAPTRFRNDLDASRYANEITRAWISENKSKLPRIVFGRVKGSVQNRVEYLTKIPRGRLFPDLRERLLIDKSPAAIYAGAIGLLLFPVLYGWRLAILPVAVLVPWISAAAMVSYARMLDAYVPLILFSNIAWLVLAARCIRHLPIRRAVRT